MKRRSSGFTAMELLVTLALAGVILGLGVPAFRDFMRNGRLTGAANELLITVVAARNEAVRSQRVVSVCPSTTPDAVNATCTAAATQGYIAFVDTDSSCTRSGTELAIPTVAHMITHTEITSTKNGSCVSFAPNGFRRVEVGQPRFLRAMFCDTRGNNAIFPTSTISFARGVEVMPTGRAAVSRLLAEMTSWNAGGNPVTCP